MRIGNIVSKNVLSYLETVHCSIPHMCKVLTITQALAFGERKEVQSLFTFSFLSPAVLLAKYDDGSENGTFPCYQA